jgi:Carboxypeptidase regulatory-like domain
MQRLRSMCILLSLALCCASFAFSQAVSGSLLGTVTDASGATVPNAQVVMTETNTGVSRATRTGEAGNYVFGDVPPGTYTVSVELTGFKKAVRSGVDVLVNATIRADLNLQPGSVSEVIILLSLTILQRRKHAANAGEWAEPPRQQPAVRRCR